jgi:flagellar basal-body rod modification protein FlgD
MPVNPLSTLAPPNAIETPGSARSNAGLLGKDDFLKLLIGQMQNQDPLNPTDSSEYMAQMTQFSILEQVSNLASSQQASAANEYDSQAIALVGRTVTYTRADGSSATGLVERVTFSSLGPTLTVGGFTGISPVTVTEIA